jgi:hypothetical protein
VGNILNFFYRQRLKNNFILVPNNYDYLDDTSVLREVVNFITDLTKSEEMNETTRKNKLSLMIKCICESCEKSTTKLLPPINWHYFINTILKSKFGKECEFDLIKLTIYQISNLNSAFSVFKNFFIDTNYFQQLEVRIFQVF